MGLAAHGNMNREDNQYYDKLSQTITQHDDASFTLDMEYYSFHTLQKMYTSKLKSLLDDPPQKTERPTKHQQDIAAALQLLTEDLLLDLMQHVYQETGRDRLVYAGGVALNSAFNGKILDKTPFNDVWIQPAASDCGGSLGAATYLNHQVSDNEVEEMKTVSLGPAYHDKDIQEYLNTQNIQYKHYTDQTQLINEVAEKISENRVVAVCRGRMEWGPRALGNRSILANPCDPEAKTRLNEHIKHREQFRPFAPSVQAEHANKYFDVPDNPHLTDYMLAVHDVKPKWQEDLPSITHVNGTARLQTVKSSRQPWFHQLLTAVNQTIGVPIVINTSFNLSGEPIVENPKDALQTLQNSKIDHLLIENNLIDRQDL
jgi:carbamoyltransferase